MKTLLNILTGISLLAAVSGCATKGPKKVYARPIPPQVKQVSPTNQAITDAPRTKPGSIMDPEAITYAQVPSRIIYLPGQHGIFGRSSAKQEVAYKLEPVDRIKAIQAQGTPEFTQSDTKTQTEMVIRDITWQTFTNEDGQRVSGNARRLGVLGQNDIEKQRAQNLLKRGEDLRWSEEIGWVGFVAEKRAKPYTPDKQQEDESIPPLDLGDTAKEPAVIEPIKEVDDMEIIRATESEEEIDLQLP